MTDLVKDVQAASASQPDWLQKKRQLAATLLARFSTSEEDQPFVTAWQQQIDTSVVEERPAVNTGSLVEMPLFEAAKQYPAMCQENLMEKGLSWQASQLNALHLALLNGGRFFYLPDNQPVTGPVVLHDDLRATNYHTLIIVGSHSRLTITDQRHWQSSVPLYSGIELLMGAHSQVSYLYNGRLSSPLAQISLHAYQAYGSQLKVIMNPMTDGKISVDVQSNLDGDDSYASLSLCHAASGAQCRFVAGVNTHQPGQSYQPDEKIISAGLDGKLNVDGHFAGDGED